MSIENSDKQDILFASKSILTSMPQFAYVFDKENKLVMWNKNLESVLGYSEEELHKKDAFDFMEEKDKEENAEVISRVFSEKKEQFVEQNILTKSGKKIPVVDTANYALIDGEEYLIGMAIDISKLKETEDKLKKQIVKTNQLKDLIYAENINLRKEIKGNDEFKEIIGESKSLINTLYLVKKVSKTDSAVLIQGEIGTRKQLFAKAIYNHSDNKNDPFIRINCTSFKRDRVEKELYDVIKNNFAEVDKTEVGKFKTINQGTLYFDEISAIPIEFQPKLLSMLQNCKFELNRGYPKVIHTNFRIITSTNQNLKELVKKNLFSNDLYFYLNTFPIVIPPLRERISDIDFLMDNFIKQFNLKYSKQISKIQKKTRNLLHSYSWPGNVKELENIIERAVILSKSNILEISEFINDEGDSKNKILTLKDFERQYITKILNMTYWRVAGNNGAARILDLHPETLRSKMRKLKISKTKYL